MTTGTSELLNVIADLRRRAATGDTTAMDALAAISALVSDFAVTQTVGDPEVTYTFRNGTTEPAELLSSPQPPATAPATDPITDAGPARLFTRTLLDPTPSADDPGQPGLTFDAEAVDDPSTRSGAGNVVPLESARPSTVEPARTVPQEPPVPDGTYPVITPTTATMPEPRALSVYGCPGPGTPLGDAQAWFYERLGEGVQCPACDRHAEIHPRQISETMARSLITMWRNARFNWFNMPEMAKKWDKRDEAMLAYWGLIEKATRENRPGEKIKGFWRVTDQGHAYIQGRLSVPQFARVYNKQVVGYEGPMVTIRDAVGVNFDVERYARGQAS